MNKIRKAFENGKAFIPFFTLGYPDLEGCRKNILAAAKAGADLIELGIPFSDPTAEGPVIQEASLISLSHGYTTDDFLAFTRSLSAEVNVPFVFMTYANVVYSYGIDRFMKNASEAGISGLILADLSYEEKDEFSIPAQEYGINLISMIAPTSADRTKMIASEADGFIYLVSSLGITGIRSEFDQSLETIVQDIRSVSDVPVAIGFGISDPGQAASMARIADGVICGSAMIKTIQEAQNDSDLAVYRFASSMKDSVRKSAQLYC